MWKLYKTRTAEPQQDLRSHGVDFGVNTFVPLVDQSTVDPSIVDRTSHTQEIAGPTETFSVYATQGGAAISHCVAV